MVLFRIGELALMCFVADEYGYQDDDIVMLTDDQRNPRSIPTRMNMVGFRFVDYMRFTHGRMSLPDSCLPVACTGRTAQRLTFLALYVATLRDDH